MNSRPATANAMRAADRVLGRLNTQPGSTHHRSELTPQELRTVVSILWRTAQRAGYVWEPDVLAQKLDPINTFLRYRAYPPIRRLVRRLTAP